MAGSRTPTGAARYRAYLLGLLAVILGFSGIDRTALGLVVQNIKGDFHLSDAQIGILSGIAFALFYSIFGIALGRWADRGNRVKIIAVTAALWSVMVMLSGAARSFGELLVIRIGVAVGESGCNPPAYSLISDYFDRSERPAAFAKYLLGGALAVFFGYFVAGWLNQLYGWRAMFAILGCPGIPVAALALLTLREPRLTQAGASSLRLSDAQVPGVLEVCRSLYSNRTYRCVLLALCFNFLFGYGIAQWQPAFFVRSFGLSTGKLGTWLSIIGIGAFVGTYLGGYLASRYAPGNERLQLRAMAILNVAFGVTSAFAYLSTSAGLALLLIGLAGTGGALLAGPFYATIQTVVPERMRATSVAIQFLFANLIGMGLGPLVVGVLSDALHPIVGIESLRYALLAMCPGYLLGSWLLWRAAVTASEDTSRALREAPDTGYVAAVGEESAPMMARQPIKSEGIRNLGLIKGHFPDGVSR